MVERDIWHKIALAVSTALALGICSLVHITILLASKAGHKANTDIWTGTGWRNICSDGVRISNICAVESNSYHIQQASSLHAVSCIVCGVWYTAESGRGSWLGNVYHNHFCSHTSSLSISCWNTHSESIMMIATVSSSPPMYNRES